MDSISTRMTERFGCRHPFASAGMAFAGGTADLALGVCAGGGIGAIGVGFTPAEKIRTIIRQIRAATDAPFNINFLTCFDNDAQIRVCAEEKVPVEPLRDCRRPQLLRGRGHDEQDDEQVFT